MRDEERAQRHKWQDGYQDYLNSTQWRVLRSNVIELARSRCVLCNVADGSLESLVAHHRTYERARDELLSDLTALCWDCHALFHRYRRTRNAKFDPPGEADDDFAMDLFKVALRGTDRELEELCGFRQRVELIAHLHRGAVIRGWKPDNIVAELITRIDHLPKKH